MANEYTIPQILERVALNGYTPVLSAAINKLLRPDNDIEYQEALKTATSEISGYRLDTYKNDLESFSDKSHFEGLPIYLPVILEKFEGVENDLFLESAVVSFNRQKNIVITEVQGRDSSVKEFINNGDYAITISGVMCAKEASYPKDQLKDFIKYMNAKQSLKIVHEVLSLIDVHEIVITDFDCPETPFVNCQPYTINAVSEEPIELILSEE